ncbi:hypothetical protein GGI24_003353 [Coemansia furcata]|nr:hypothetical protein GGI24_003353 [Coemansia furcata]
MHNNSMAQRTAFYNFYCWRRCNDGTHRSPAMLSSKEEGNVANNTSTMPGGPKGSQLKHKHTHDMVVSSDDNSNNGDSVVNLAILEAEAEHAEQAVQSSQPKAPVTPVTPARNRRCNIHAIREEDAEVLETHHIQRQAEEEVNRRMQMAAASSPNDHKDAAASQTSVIVPIEVDNDDDNDSNIMVGGDDEIIVLGTMPPATSSTVKVDIGKIGTPTLINTGHFDDQSDVMIPGFIAAQLKPHQLQGVRFMWRNLVMLSNHQSSTGDKGTSSSGRLILAQHGCILAHSMGLGKTLQTITLIYTLLNAVSTPTPIPDFVGSNFNMCRMLILCPPTIQANWTAEFWKWTGVHPSMADVSSYHKAIDSPLLPLGFGDNDSILGKGGMDRRTKLPILQALHRELRRVVTQVINFGLMQNMKMRLVALSAWHQHGGIMIMGYPGFRELMRVIDNCPRKRAMAAAATVASGRDSSSLPGPPDPELPQVLVRRYLLEEGLCLVVADEGHVIKNSDALLSKYVNMLKTKARMCLTGYLLQNNLIKYWTMVNFCSPKFLSELADFRNSYVNPIGNSLYLDSSPTDKHTSMLRMKALQSLLESIVDCRDMNVLHSQLPCKAEYVITCLLMPAQMRLYSAYLAHVVGIGPNSEDSSIVQAASSQNLLVHCSVLSSICNHPAICHSVVTSNTSTSTAAAAKRAQAEISPISIDESAGLDQLEDLAQELGSGGGSSNVGGRNIDWCKVIFASYLEPDQNLRLPPHCLKVVLMLDIIHLSIAQGERVLVFMCSIPTLDYLQQAVQASGILATSGSSLRIDGSTNVSYCQDLIDSFNAPDLPHYLFFISSATGLISVNLVTASQVIIFYIGWNLLYNEQAIACAYHYGQHHHVYVYHLITAGTWEDNMFSNNMFKAAMTHHVVDHQSTGCRITCDDM